LKLFLDANVLFTAAHNPDGKAAFIIELSQAGHWEVATSPLAYEEAKRNLEVKFPDGFDRVDVLIQNVDLVPDVFEGECPINLPEKDRPIFLSASGGACTHLLTGDLKHFGPFMNEPEKTKGILIQTAGEFLDAVL
jgi:hypothetical protein